MIPLRVRVIGTGVAGDPLRAPHPTYNQIRLADALGFMEVQIPDEDATDGGRRRRYPRFRHTPPEHPRP